MSTTPLLLPEQPYRQRISKKLYVIKIDVDVRFDDLSAGELKLLS